MDFLSRLRGLTNASVTVIFALVAIAMMIVPVPTFVLDLMLTLNLGLAIIILVAVATGKRIVDLSAFPSWLMLTTLLRLSLNVSSVRAILARGDAGRVIDAFGSAVIRGDVVVGLALFVMLALVQYLVIARGAERVAEVAARFALDAMPGRQLAIDADLRAAAITPEAANQRRESLQHEARIFGALDGTMRFVKGDAIAGMIIVAIAFVVGLALGVVRDGRSLSDALSTYARLSVGDGLVTQIPSLLLSLAAGLLVTKSAASTDGDASLSLSMLLSPRALSWTGVFLFALALVPGLPLAPFAVLALVCFVAAWRLRTVAAATTPAAARSKPRALSIALSPELALALPSLDLRVATQTSALSNELGIVLPVPSILIDATLPPRTVSFRAWELPVFSALIPDGRVLAETNAADLPTGFDAIAAPHPRTSAPAAWIPRSRKDEIAARGFGVLEGVEVFDALLASFLEQSAPELLGLEETRALLDELAGESPALVRDLVPARLSLSRMTSLLRGLVAEGVPLRPLREILESLSALDPETLASSSTLKLTERLRSALRRAISHRHAPSLRLPALLLDSSTESMVRDSLRHSDRGVSIALEPELHDELLAALSAAEQRHPPARALVLMTAPDLRPHLRRLVAEELPWLPVLAYSEVLPTVEIETVARVGLTRSGSGPTIPQ